VTLPERFNLTLRGLMEMGIVCGFGYWGYSAGGPFVAKVSFAVAAPLVGFGVWGMVDFRQAGAMAEPLRLIEELLISGLAALALYTASAHLLGWALGLVSVVHHALVYALKGRLIKRAPAAR
jgi:hypothetical protein